MMEGGLSLPKLPTSNPVTAALARAKAAKAALTTSTTSLKSSATAVTSSATSLKTAASDISAQTKLVQTWISDHALYIAGGIVVVIALIALIWYYSGFTFKKESSTATSAALGTATTNSTPLVSGFESGPEGFQVPTVPPQEISAEDVTLINLQPLAIKDAGFLGPYPNGMYDAVTATGNALKAGFRFLTLQIDYMDSAKEGFETPKHPTLLIRAANGALLTKNSGSIAEVAETVANMAFRPEVPHNMQPVILYLHVVRAPSPIQDPDGYMIFLSKIAQALNPLAPMHLGLSPLGNFTRQKMADSLLTTPIRSLEGQVIILCNADTSAFRKKVNGQRYDPAQDLDFWVNMRVYLDSEEDSLGITHLPDPNDTIQAVVADANRLVSLSPSKTEAFAAKGKRRYVIAMPSRTANLTAQQVDKAINNLGVNAVPLDIFTDTTASVMNIVSEYANMPYHPKPIALRNIS